MVMRTTRLHNLGPLLLLLAGCAPVVSSADNWPQFRGPGGAGRSDAYGVPIHWSETANVAWKTTIHDKGWSSPVLWGNQIWLTTAKADGTQMFALCIDRASGKIVRDIKIFDIPHPAYCIPFNSYASPTPAIEAGRVYVHFGSYGTECLDTETGGVIWSRRDLPCNHFRGPGSSPILYGGMLFINFDGFDYQYVVALDKNSGATVWRKDRTIDYGTDNGDFKKAFGTPSIIEANGEPQLVSTAAVATIAYAPRTGDEIWTVRHGGMNSAAPPQFAKGKVIISPGDGKLLAIRPDGKGDVTGSHVAWRYGRAVPARTSPLVVDNLLYMVNEHGIASCVDVETGQNVWQERIGNDFCASPVFADGHIYFADLDGNTTVIEPGRACKKIAVNKLDDGCMATPAIAGGDLIVRTKTHLYCIRRK
jgi:outer membrane protein assembly factor BamB